VEETLCNEEECSNNKFRTFGCVSNDLFTAAETLHDNDCSKNSSSGIVTVSAMICLQPGRICCSREGSVPVAVDRQKPCERK
jgi:hypothetical protein